MIEKYLDILKDPKSHQHYSVLNIAMEGSQAAFDAILEFAREIRSGSFNLDELTDRCLNPFHMLMRLYDKGELRENYDFFKQNLDLLIQLDPCYKFNTWEFFNNDFTSENYKSFFNLYNKNSLINDKDMADIIHTMMCKTKFTDKYEKNYELYKTNSNYVCIFDIILRRGLCAFLNNNQNFGSSGFGKETLYLDINSNLFDFIYMFKEESTQAFLTFDSNQNLLLDKHSLHISKMMSKDKLRTYYFSDNKNPFEEEALKTFRMLNNCFRRWECWQEILWQSEQLIFVKNYDMNSDIYDDDDDYPTPFRGKGSFKGVETFDSTELSEIGKSLVGASLKVAEMGSIFIKKLEAKFGDLLSQANVFEVEDYSVNHDLLKFDLKKILQCVSHMEDIVTSNSEYYKSFDEYKKLYEL